MPRCGPPSRWPAPIPAWRAGWWHICRSRIRARSGGSSPTAPDGRLRAVSECEKNRVERGLPRHEIDKLASPGHREEVGSRAEDRLDPGSLIIVWVNRPGVQYRAE